MACKNCNTNLLKNANYCTNCGAKIIVDRITFKTLVFSVIIKAFGWDNKYFVTIKNLFVKPEVIFNDYINGVRKRYVNPITFFIVGMTVSLIVFNVFHDQYMERTSFTSADIEASIIESESIADSTTPSAEEAKFKKEIEKAQRQFTVFIQNSILKYFNVFSFLLLPIYTLIAFWVFGKKHNYGEHLIIASYIQGVLFLVTTLIFLISLIGPPEVYAFTSILTMFYYSYAYGRLYKQSFGKRVLYFLKFLGISILIIISIILVGVLFGIIIGLGMKISGQ